MLDNYRDLIDELLGTPSEVRSLVEGAGGEPPAEVKRLVAEVRDRDREVTGRLQTIMRDEVAHLSVVGEEAGGDIGTTGELLQGMDQARGDLVSLLMNLTLKDWERTATHDIDGEISLADEVERHVEFDEDRLRRIRSAMSVGG